MIWQPSNVQSCNQYREKFFFGYFSTLHQQYFCLKKVEGRLGTNCICYFQAFNILPLSKSVQ